MGTRYERRVALTPPAGAPDDLVEWLRIMERLNVKLGKGLLGSEWICESCFSTHYGVLRATGRAWSPPVYACEVCGCQFSPKDRRRAGARKVCTPECGREAANTSRKIAHSERECPECGDLFVAARRDAVYCPGGACKQRAYRRRRGLERAGGAAISES